ncbi:MAG: hypothetical protein PHF86_01495 [Candidatus Nanoarchaeia archaeon]|nr:hypothetical protein [Candidatus Nanoarchaeia archaeon]
MRKRNKRELKSKIKTSSISHSITLDVIGGDKMDKLKNNFMHAGDVFEKGKHLARLYQIKVTGDPDLDKLCENIKNVYEKASEGYVLFVAIRNIDEIRCKKPRVFLKEGIHSISNGHEWGLFRNILLDMGYKPKTNEHMIVESVS